ncbi:MAG: helix-turn-helix domain-containing protein [Verrucomicrobiota bacterium]
MKITELGQAIRARRKAAGITQLDLAELSGVALHTISDLECGKGNPTFSVLGQLCSVLGLEISLGVKALEPVK